MMKTTDINVILDRSQSMGNILQATIDGYNNFVKSQNLRNELVQGPTYFSLNQFDTKYEVNYTNVPCSEVPLLTEKTFIPRNWTALTDAIAITLLDLAERWLAQPDSERPSKVMVVIQTDGQENSSKIYNKETVRAMCLNAQFAWGWKLLFIGCSNVEAVAKSYGIGEEDTIQYAATEEGVTGMFATVTARTAEFQAE
jgi:hypothetical protein